MVLFVIDEVTFLSEFFRSLVIVSNIYRDKPTANIVIPILTTAEALNLKVQTIYIHIQYKQYELYDQNYFSPEYIVA